MSQANPEEPMPTSNPPPTFKLGDRVEWSPKGNPAAKLVGTVVEVVPPGVVAKSHLPMMAPDDRRPRDHESYVVKLDGSGRGRYWPRLMSLRLIGAGVDPCGDCDPCGAGQACAVTGTVERVAPEVVERIHGGEWKPVAVTDSDGDSDATELPPLAAPAVPATVDLAELARELAAGMEPVTAASDAMVVALGVAMDAECRRRGVVAHVVDIAHAARAALPPGPVHSPAAQAALSAARMRLRTALRTSHLHLMVRVATGAVLGAAAKADVVRELASSEPPIAGVTAEFMNAYAGAVLDAMADEWRTETRTVIDEELDEHDALVSIAAAYGPDDTDVRDLFRFVAGGVYAILRRRTVKLPAAWLTDKLGERLHELATARARMLIGDGASIATHVRDYLVAAQARGSLGWLASRVGAATDDAGLRTLGEVVLATAGSPAYPSTDACLIAGRVATGFVAAADRQPPQPAADSPTEPIRWVPITGHHRALLACDLVEGMTIYAVDHPEWGPWKVTRDRNGWIATNARGSKMLDPGELEFWSAHAEAPTAPLEHHHCKGSDLKRTDLRPECYATTRNPSSVP